MSDFRTPLGRVRGHGAAKSGTGDFIVQRGTAVALLVLAPSFTIAAALLIDSHGEAIQFLRTPWFALHAILLVVAATTHMRIGMRAVIEDYIAKPLTRTLLFLANAFFTIALMAAGVLAVLQINFGW